MEGHRGVVEEVEEGVQNLGRRVIGMKAGISVCVVVVVLMVSWEWCMCFEPCFLSVVEANCIEVVSFLVEDAIFELSGCFVVVVVEVEVQMVVEVEVEMVVEVEVENFELSVGCVISLFLWCLNEKGGFLVTLESDAGGNECV